VTLVGHLQDACEASGNAPSLCRARQLLRPQSTRDIGIEPESSRDFAVENALPDPNAQPQAGLHTAGVPR